MAVSWGIRISAIALLAALSLTLAGVSPGGSSPRADAWVIKAPPQSRFLLGLSDLPPGYRLFGGPVEYNSGGLRCGALTPEDSRLSSFIQGSPKGCLALYLRTYRVPGSGPAPLAVGTGVARLKSVAAAEEALDLAPFLISHVTNDELPTAASTPGQVGERTVAFHWGQEEKLFKERPETTTFLLWRWGATVGAIFVAGTDAAANDRAALALAQRQQIRFEVPPPLSDSVFDDSEVALENPEVDTPIYWLGRSFGGRGKLPVLRLEDSFSLSRQAAEGPLGLFYADRPGRPRYQAVWVFVHSAASWKRASAGAGPAPGVPDCDVTARPLQLARGSATVFSGREGRPGDCLKRAPITWTLRARIGGTVVVAGTSEICSVCARPGRAGYNSLAGMRAIARGLELRQP